MYCGSTCFDMICKNVMLFSNVGNAKKNLRWRNGKDATFVMLVQLSF